MLWNSLFGFLHHCSNKSPHTQWLIQYIFHPRVWKVRSSERIRASARLHVFLPSSLREDPLPHLGWFLERCCCLPPTHLLPKPAGPYFLTMPPHPFSMNKDPRDYPGSPQATQNHCNGTISRSSLATQQVPSSCHHSAYYPLSSNYKRIRGW